MIEASEKKSLIQRSKRWLKGAWQSVRPGKEAWRGAAYGVAALYLVMVVAFALGQAASDSWGGVTFVALMLFGLILAALSGLLADLVLTIAGKIPSLYRIVLVGVAFLLAQMFFQNYGPQGLAVLIGGVIGAGSLLGIGVWTLARRRWSALNRPRQVISIAGVVLGTAAIGSGLAWYLWPGPAVAPAPNTALAGEDLPPLLQAADPSLPGPYVVQTLTYGSGEDRRRPEYGAAAALVTQAVDGTPLIENWKGINGALRTAYWGFGPEALPLNGRVWYPDGEGPFPLALIVHGNHEMTEHSDPGYAYLGELLASRGMILASVDENFLNGGWVDWIMFGVDQGLKEDNDARGWLMLEHLAQWARWNETPGNPFFNRVDMEQIAVIGHSRGGEAAAIAAAFNRLSAYPGDANQIFDYDFGIRAVVAIAPVDGQYMPTGRSTPLENVHYLLLQGAYDGDMRPMMGVRQYNRIQFTDGGEWFKALVYMDQANHGQFNNIWGRADRSGFPKSGLLNLGPIMSEQEQQQIARVLISAFLEATLRDETAYRELFRDLRSGREWLPQVAYITRYADSHTAYVATFEEDVDATTATLPGVTLRGEHLSQWQEKKAELKWGDQQTNAVYLGWKQEGEAAQYSLDLRGAEFEVSAESSLVFSLAAGSSDREPLDLTVEVVDRAGKAARLPLSYVAPLQPQIEFHILKARFLEEPGMRSAEPVFQSYIFPWAAFQAVEQEFDPTALAEVRWIMDRSEKGVVILDDVGIQNQ